jgi:hypothetical protein
VRHLRLLVDIVLASREYQVADLVHVQTEQVGCLVRILAISHRPPVRRPDCEIAGPALYLGAQPRSNCGVIPSRRAQRIQRAGLELALRNDISAWDLIAPTLKDEFEFLVLGNHQHMPVVLRRRTQQRHPADVDHLDRLLERAIRVGHSLLERVQVHHHHVDRLDPVRFELPHMLGVVAVGQDAGVDRGVQRLHPAVEHLGIAGDVLDQRDRDAGLTQCPGRAAGGDDLDAEFVVQRAGEVDDAGLVVDTDQAAANGARRGHWASLRALCGASSRPELAAAREAKPS